MSGAVITISTAVIIFIILFLFSSFIKEEIRMIGYMICVIAAIAGVVWYVTIKKEREKIYKQYKACLPNIPKLAKKVEEFNIKYTHPMKNLDLKLLKEREFINKEFLEDLNILKSANGCEYINEGDLSKEGIIICKKHGDEKKIAQEMKKYE